MKTINRLIISIILLLVAILFCGCSEKMVEAEEPNRPNCIAILDEGGGIRIVNCTFEELVEPNELEWIDEGLVDYLMQSREFKIAGFDEITRKNIQKKVDYWYEIAKNIRSVNVMRTIDTNNYVITIKDAKGKEASLWLKQDGSIRAITQY